MCSFVCRRPLPSPWPGRWPLHSHVCRRGRKEVDVASATARRGARVEELALQGSLATALSTIGAEVTPAPGAPASQAGGGAGDTGQAALHLGSSRATWVSEATWQDHLLQEGEMSSPDRGIPTRGSV